jgi:hypothetical protein
MDIGAMRKRRYSVVIAAVLSVTVICWHLLATREPKYEGKPLSFWLKGYDVQWGRSPVSKKTERAEELADKAIACAGTNAIPTLMRMFEARDSALITRLVAASRRMHINVGEFPNAPTKHQRAASALMALGPRARSAVPYLIRIYDRNVSESSRETILIALSSMGPTARQAGPSLVRWLAHKTFSEPGMVLSTWEALDLPPEDAIPDLVGVLADTNPATRIWASRLLADYGYSREAAKALPALDKSRQLDPDTDARNRASNTYQYLAERAAKDWKSR